MLTHDEINQCIERAAMYAAQVIGVDEMKEVLDKLAKDEHMSEFIYTVALETSMSSIFRGLEMHEKEQSILLLKDGLPVLVNDKTNKSLAVVVPRNGKYYVMGSDVEVNIKPDCWYDIEILQKEEINGDNVPAASTT